MRFRDGSINYSAIGRLAGCKADTVRKAESFGVEVTDIAAVKAFRDSRNQRMGEAQRARLAFRMKQDPLFNKVAELRARKYSLLQIASELGISIAQARVRCRAAGMGKPVRVNQGFKPETHIMQDYRDEMRAVAKLELWHRHKAITSYAALQKYRADPKAGAAKCRRIYHATKHTAAFKAARSRKKKKWRAKPKNRARNSLSARLYLAIKNHGGRKDRTLEQCLGCTVKQGMKHLEAQFIGCMTWGNYGKAWHIDHIVPCSYFDLSKEDEQRRCFHFSNLRPLWAKTNMREADKRGAQTIPMWI